WILSPEVLIGTNSTRNPDHRFSSWVFTHPACQRAKTLPRVPMRREGVTLYNLPCAGQRIVPLGKQIPEDGSVAGPTACLYLVTHHLHPGRRYAAPLRYQHFLGILRLYCCSSNRQSEDGAVCW